MLWMAVPEVLRLDAMTSVECVRCEPVSGFMTRESSMCLMRASLWLHDMNFGFNVSSANIEGIRLRASLWSHDAWSSEVCSQRRILFKTNPILATNRKKILMLSRCHRGNIIIVIDLTLCFTAQRVPTYLMIQARDMEETMAA
jgi:hypothetical protein